MDGILTGMDMAVSVMPVGGGLIITAVGIVRGRGLMAGMVQDGIIHGGIPVGTVHGIVRGTAHGITVGTILTGEAVIMAAAVIITAVRQVVIIPIPVVAPAVDIIQVEHMLQDVIEPISAEATEHLPVLPGYEA